MDQDKIAKQIFSSASKTINFKNIEIFYESRSLKPIKIHYKLRVLQLNADYVDVIQVEKHITKNVLHKF